MADTTNKQVLLKVKGLKVAYGGIQAVKAVDLQVFDGELVTLVSGAEGGDLAERVETWVQENHPAVDVVVYQGGQARYPLLFSVE